jgi:hypothetical protein
VSNLGCYISLHWRPRVPQHVVVVVIAFNMDVVKAVETYINKLVSTPPSMKVLLLDSHTVRRPP